MSSTFSESNLIKKLEHVSNTQDSIQTLSLWVLHHKSHYKSIVEQWLKCYLKAKSSHQLALFYLANDIVQHAKRKSLAHYLNEFKSALREAVKMTNDSKIVPNITRVFNIWQERNIYSKEYIEELRGLLCGEDVKLEVLSKIVSDYSSVDIINEINNSSKAEQFTKNKLQSLVNCKVDFANTELLNKLKDKSYGEQFSKEFDEATKCLDSVIGSLEKEIASREKLLAKLDKAKLFYEIQQKEAKQVVEAFNNCEVHVSQVKTFLNKFSVSQGPSLASDGITTSQLSSVINLIQQAQSGNPNPMSSLEQRLSMMSNSGQFGLALNQDNQAFGYDPNYQANYNASAYSDQYYEPQDGSQGLQMGARNEPTENLEPADMDLGDSDDDDNAAATTKRFLDANNKNNIEENNKKRRTMEMAFINPQDLSSMFPLLPPPPPPPLPPPALKDLFVPPSLDDEFDPFGSYNAPPIPSLDNHLHGNSILSLADRQSRNSGPYHSNHSNNNNNNWRNSSDNRLGPRSQNYNLSHHNSNHSNRSMGNRGSWKRYGNHH